MGWLTETLFATHLATHSAMAAPDVRDLVQLAPLCPIKGD